MQWALHLLNCLILPTAFFGSEKWEALYYLQEKILWWTFSCNSLVELFFLTQIIFWGRTIPFKGIKIECSDSHMSFSLGASCYLPTWCFMNLLQLTYNINDRDSKRVNVVELFKSEDYGCPFILPIAREHIHEMRSMRDHSVIMDFHFYPKYLMIYHVF